jgi:hypothetical protein
VNLHNPHQLQKRPLRPEPEPAADLMAATVRTVMACWIDKPSTVLGGPGAGTSVLIVDHSNDPARSRVRQISDRLERVQA